MATSNPSVCDVKTLTLYNFTKTRKVSLKNFYVEININEELFKPYIYGNIVIHDTVDLITQFPLLGEEWLDIEFNTELRKDLPNRKYSSLFCYNIADYKMDQTGKSCIYTIYFICEDQFTNAKDLISRNYSGSVSDIITRILKNDIKTTSNVSAQQTTGTVDFTFPKQTYFEIINFLRLRAYSDQQNDTNYFLFFQNVNGYTFTSLTNLIKTGLERKTALESNKISTSINLNDLRYINTHDNPEEFTRNINFASFARIKNTLDSLKSSAYNLTENYYDLSTRTLQTVNRNYSNTFNQTQHIDGSSSYPKHTDEFLQVVQNTKPNMQLSFLNSAMPDYNNTTKLSSSRLQHFMMLEESPLPVTIYGDPVIVTGDIINVLLPEMSSAKDKTLDRYRSGNYLVGRQVHNIKLSTYKMHLHLYKDSFNNKIQPNPSFSLST